MRNSFIQRFLQLESASGILLLFAAFAAMLLANSPFAVLHQKFITISLFWINEVLMALFFLLVGIELKHGYLQGIFSSFSQVVLPIVAAFGGMLIPALIYLAINYNNPATLKGWATPVATDIAFALGVLTLFGRQIPIALKLFLLALAIFDDLGAIIIIALFYSSHLSVLWLFLSFFAWLVLYFISSLSVRSLFVYLSLGIILWGCLYASGIHPAISGFLLALTIPGGSETSPLQTLEDFLHPWVAYLIMPLFALANAGFSLHNLTWQSLTDTIVLGIILGLFLGKQIGVFSLSWLFIRQKWAKLPKDTSWLQLYGVSILCGIGFTMSLFLGTLSFQNESLFLAEVRLGVIVGSLLSGLVGAMVLAVALSNRSKIVD